MKIINPKSVISSFLLLAHVPSVSAQEDSGDWATIRKGLVTVHSCYDQSSKAVELRVEFSGVEADENEELPWMAIGYRPTKDCRMTTVDGESEIVLLSSTTSSEALLLKDASPNTTLDSIIMDPSVYHGVLPALANVERNEQSSIDATYDSLVAINDKEGFSLVELTLPTTSKLITMHYRQEVAELPESLPLMYAVGRSPFLGFHQLQACFEVTQFPACQGSLEDSSAFSTRQSSSIAFFGILLVAGISTFSVFL